MIGGERRTSAIGRSGSMNSEMKIAERFCIQFLLGSSSEKFSISQRFFSLTE
jgi:hypothetical protein